MSAVGKSIGKASRNGDNSQNLYPVKLTFIFSLLAWPITFVYNNGMALIDQGVRPFWMMAIGFLVLVAIGYASFKFSKISDWLFIGIVVFAFSSVIDLIITLEQVGFITNFMSEYLKYGEAYLFCSWGTAICFFDAIGFYTMYHLIVYFMTNGQSWRSVGIYWGSGILNSMIVLLLGALVGQVHTPTFCILLNVPFVIFPAFVLIRAFSTEKRCIWNSRQPPRLILQLADLILVLGFLASIWVTLAKGLSAFGCRGWPVWSTISSEPALLLDDPAPFAILQAVVFLFYVVPIQCVSLVYLFKNEKPQFLWETAVVHAGAMMQAQFTFLFVSLSPETTSTFRSDWNDPQLWILNLLLAIVPHLFLLRLWAHRQTLKVTRVVKKQ